MSRFVGLTLNPRTRTRDPARFCDPLTSLCLFPACSMSLHVRMCARLRLRAPRWPACVPCAYASWCVCVRVYVCVPGESVAGQCVPPDPGHAGGGDADDRQPLRLCFPPLLVSAHLQRLQGPPARGTPPPHPPQTLLKGRGRFTTEAELQISSLPHRRRFRSVRKCELTTASQA